MVKRPTRKRNTYIKSATSLKAVHVPQLINEDAEIYRGPCCLYADRLTGLPAKQWQSLKGSKAGKYKHRVGDCEERGLIAGVTEH